MLHRDRKCVRRLTPIAQPDGDGKAALGRIATAKAPAAAISGEWPAGCRFKLSRAARGLVGRGARNGCCRKANRCVFSAPRWVPHSGYPAVSAPYDMGPHMSGAPWAALAQPVEHRIRNAGVRCSSHLGGTIPSFWPTFPHRLRPSQIVSKILI